MSEITRLSYTAISTYLNCPRAFMYRYIKREPTILTGRLIAGRAYHHGVAFALSTKKSGNTVNIDEVTDIVSGAWQSYLVDKLVYNELGEPKIEAVDVDWGDDDPGKLKDSIIKLVKMYIKQILPELKPTAVEEKIKADIDGVPCIGYIDVMSELSDKTTLVIDHKLYKRSISDVDASKDLQMSIYATLLGKPIVCAFHQALLQKKLQVKKVLTERNNDDISWTTGLIKEVWKGIQSGIYPPNPTSWTCSEKSCSYFTTCRVLMED